MDNFLLQAAGVIFLSALAIMMFRMFAGKGSKLKALTYLIVYAVILLAFSRIVNINPGNEPDSLVQEIQSIEMQNYLTDSRNSYYQGLRALESKNYLQAIELLSLVIPGDPNYEEARVKLAQAKEVYAGQLLDEGKQKMSAGDFEEAVTALEQALTYNPNLTEARKLKLDALTQKQAVLKKEAAQKAAMDLRRGKEQMGQWEFGAGSLGVSVGKTKVSAIIPTNEGFSYTSRGNERFLWVYVSVFNKGKSGVKIDPDSFYISAPDGYRIARNEATFSQAHLPLMTLKPGATTEGWIIFYVSPQKQYKLYYYGTGGEVEKVIVP